MGWKGTLRAIAAAQRAAQRSEARRQRLVATQLRESERADERHRAALEVEYYESRIAQIKSVHRDCAAAIDWRAMATAPAPDEPERGYHQEERARNELDAYYPSLSDKLLRRVHVRRRELEEAVADGIMADAKEHEERFGEYVRRSSDRDAAAILAHRVLQGDPDAFRDAVEELQPFSELDEMGSRITMLFRADHTAEATLHVNGAEVVPGEIKTLTQTGRVSVRDMPISRFNELYQDFVAGSVFRVARELLALLPLSDVTVTAVASVLNTATGHLEVQPMLSVVVPRRTVQDLNFMTLDPSEALRMFNHRMDFRKNRGFAPVASLARAGDGEV